MLDDRDHPTGHEAGTANRLAGTSRLRHFDQSPTGRDFHPAACLGGHDVKGLDRSADVDQNLHPVAEHRNRLGRTGRHYPMARARVAPTQSGDARSTATPVQLTHMAACRNPTAMAAKASSPTGSARLTWRATSVLPRRAGSTRPTSRPPES